MPNELLDGQNSAHTGRPRRLLRRIHCNFQPGSSAQCLAARDELQGLLRYTREPNSLSFSRELDPGAAALYQLAHHPVMNLSCTGSNKFSPFYLASTHTFPF